MSTRTRTPQLPQRRHFMVTYNNPTHTADEFLNLFKPHVDYIVFQHEVGKKSGTPHFQIYMYMKKQCRITAIHKICPGLAVKPKYAKSTPAQCRTYCMKSDTRTEGPWEFGTCPITDDGKAVGQGRRTDLEAVHGMIKEGKSYYQITEEFPAEAMKFHSGIKAVIRVQPPPPKVAPNVMWLWGETGTGKSHLAYHDGDIPLEDICMSNPDKSRVFEQYTGQKRFIFDDYSPDQVSHGDLKRYLDKYPIMVKTMYDTRHFNPVEIFVTCSYPPSQWWAGNKLAEIERRCNKGIHQLTVVWKPDEEDPELIPDTQQYEDLPGSMASPIDLDSDLEDDSGISMEEMIKRNELAISNARIINYPNDENYEEVNSDD